MARFGWNAIQSAQSVARRFSTKEPRAVFAGMAAHSIVPLDRWGAAAFGLVLWTTCYSVGWPFAAGGSQLHCQRPRRVAGKIGWQDHYRSSRRLARRIRLGPRRSVRRHPAPAACSRRRAHRAHRAPPPRRIPLRARRFPRRWTGRSTGPIVPGMRPAAHAPARCTSAALSRKLPNRREPRGKESTANDLSCCWRSPPPSIPVVLQPVSMPSGPTATFRTATRWT